MAFQDFKNGVSKILEPLKILHHLLKAYNFVQFNKNIYTKIREIKEIADNSFQNPNIKEEIIRIQTLAKTLENEFPKEITDERYTDAIDNKVSVYWVYILLVIIGVLMGSNIIKFSLSLLGK